MTATRAPDDRTARVRMILVAEQLFAQHGIEGVSLRKIGLDAGQRFKSAPQYYFGDRDNLVAAVLAYRQEGINERREAMLAELEVQGRLGDVRGLMGALVHPLAELVGTDAASYLGFLASLSRYRQSEEFLAAVERYKQAKERDFVLAPGRPYTAGAVRITELLREILASLDPADLHNRVALLEVMVIYGLSQIPRLVSDSPLPPEEAVESFVESLIDGLTLVMTGPPAPFPAVGRGSTDGGAARAAAVSRRASPSGPAPTVPGAHRADGCG